MALTQIERYVRPYEEARENMLDRSRRGTFEYTKHEEVAAVLDRLNTLDHDTWAAAFSEAAAPYEQRAREAEARGDASTAEQAYLSAYAYYRLARYPTTNSPGKKAAYEKSVASYLKAARYFDPPLERVEIPFAARPDEGVKIIAYWRRPRGSERVPAVVSWGGIDGYKEDRRAQPFLERGIAMLAVDNAGVGHSPIKGAADADRLFDTLLDWIQARPDVDAQRVGIMGASTGGYWAAKLAHTRRDRIRCAVNHGGCAHYAFTPEWIEKAQHGEYAYELAETLAYAFYGDDAGFDEWLERSPSLSLVTQGVLDQPSAPLLCVNGTKDTIFPIEDMWVLFEQGTPKWGYFPPVGHMGHTPATAGVILSWVADQLGV
ncbi:MAG TPA: alpha/beta hydrolase [Chloroflexota bacterium]